MQHDLLALMQQDAEHRAKDKDRNIGIARRRFRRHHDVAALGQEEAGDVGDAHEELLAGDLPGRAGRGLAGKLFWNLAAADRDLRRTLGRARDQPRQVDLACHRKPGNPIELHPPASQKLTPTKTITPPHQ